MNEQNIQTPDQQQLNKRHINKKTKVNEKSWIILFGSLSFQSLIFMIQRDTWTNE